MLWLHVARSNNQLNILAKFYLDAVEKFGGCPVDLVTDLGTENGTIAAIQAFFRDDPNSHQRIEAWGVSFASLAQFDFVKLGNSITVLWSEDPSGANTWGVS